MDKDKLIEEMGLAILRLEAVARAHRSVLKAMLIKPAGLDPAAAEHLLHVAEQEALNHIKVNHPWLEPFWKDKFEDLGL